jgi:hypothetical protein
VCGRRKSSGRNVPPGQPSTRWLTHTHTRGRTGTWCTRTSSRVHSHAHAPGPSLCCNALRGVATWRAALLTRGAAQGFEAMIGKHVNDHDCCEVGNQTYSAGREGGWSGRVAGLVCLRGSLAACTCVLYFEAARSGGRLPRLLRLLRSSYIPVACTRFLPRVLVRIARARAHAAPAAGAASRAAPARAAHRPAARAAERAAAPEAAASSYRRRARARRHASRTRMRKRARCALARTHARVHMRALAQMGREGERERGRGREREMEGERGGRRRLGLQYAAAAKERGEAIQPAVAEALAQPAAAGRAVSVTPPPPPPVSGEA